MTPRRRLQLIGLIILMVINGIAEAISLASFIPFISILTNHESFYNLELVYKISTLLGITNSSQLLLPITIIFCTLVIISSSIRLLNIWCIGQLTARLEIDLSYLVYKRNLYQTYSEYTKKNSSDILATVMSYSAAAVSAIDALLRITSATLLALSILISLILFNWKMAFTCIGIFSFFYLTISKTVRRKLEFNGKLEASLDREKIRSLQEGLGGFRDLLINGTQDVYLSSFEKYQRKLKIKLAESSYLSSFPRYAIEALCLISIAIFALLLSNSNNKVISFIPLLGTYALASQKLLPTFQQLYSGWAAYKWKYAGVKLLLKELEKPFSIEVDRSKIPPLPLNKEIHFNDLNFSYSSGNDYAVLKNINLKIKKGDRLGIIGETGSGKSTLLDILMGLLKPTGGQFLIDGADLYCDNNPLNVYRWRYSISHVPQHIFLTEGTIAQNIAFGKSHVEIDFDEIIEAARKAKLLDFINKTKYGFDTYVGERGIRLSGGQRQRIGIARALFNKTNILILDEATSALDINTEASILESINQLNEELTIITVTHRVNTLRSCNRLIRVKEGSLFEEIDTSI